MPCIGLEQGSPEQGSGGGTRSILPVPFRSTGFQHPPVPFRSVPRVFKMGPFRSVPFQRVFKMGPFRSVPFQLGTERNGTDVGTERRNGPERNGFNP